MTPTEIRSVFERIGGGATKKLGQHFLIDRKALETIVETADIHRGDAVLEIGPGLGVLTQALLEQGASVTALERDRRFVSYLSDTFADEVAKKKVKIVEGDAARIDWMEHVDDSWVFVSNLPYAITSLALRLALYTSRPAERVVVLIQREVAERAVAKDGKMSLLSLMVALAAREVKIVRRVPPGAFFPPPKVESAILKIVPLSPEERIAKWGIDPERVMEIAKNGFAHPRKLLASNLKIEPGILEKIGVNAKARAEDVPPEKWVQLARV